MLTLYFSPGAASLCVHQLLIELGVEHKLERVDMEAKQQKSPEYLRLNPGGVVPTLVVDGEAMVESGAMLMWLAEQDPQSRFVPGEGHRSRRDYLQWFLLLANGLQPPFRDWFYAHEAAGETAASAVKERARTRIEAMFEHKSDFVELRQLLFMLMRWSRNMPKPAGEWPYCAMFIASMKARPSFKTLYAREGLTEWA